CAYRPCFCRAPSVALANPAMDHGPGLARPAVCPLANPCRGHASRGPCTIASRSLRRISLDRYGAFLDERGASSIPAAHSRALHFFRTQRPHLRHRRQQARGVLFLPRRSQSSCGLGRAKFLSSSLLLRSHVESQSWRLGGIPVSSCASNRRAAVPLSPKRTGI